jgi:hypothetical protein
MIRSTVSPTQTAPAHRGRLPMIVIAGALCLAACGLESPGGGGDPGQGVSSTTRSLTTDAWLGPISEEAGKNKGDCRTLTGDGSAVARAAGCIGSFCDDMYLDCWSAPDGISPNPTATLLATSFVSEENGSPAAKCPAGSIINGLQARGSNADDVSALCVPTSFNDAVWAPLGVICNWTWWLSEEHGGAGWPYSGYGSAQGFGGVYFGFATAVRCTGSYCDNMSYFACGSVNNYTSHEFSAHDDRGYAEEGDWSPGDFKGECDHGGSVDYMTGISANGIGISPELRPHRALCIGNSDRLDFYAGTSFNWTNWKNRLLSHHIANGDDRGDTGTGDWDPNFFKAECGRFEVMVGISQTQAHRVSRILCAPMNQVQSNVSHCTTLAYSSHSDNRLNTLSRLSTNAPTTDWDPGYAKNECGLNQILKGVSSNRSTGEIHALLCCDQQPDAMP